MCAFMLFLSWKYVVGFFLTSKNYECSIIQGAWITVQVLSYKDMPLISTSFTAYTRFWQVCPIHIRLKNIRYLVAILEILFDSWDQFTAFFCSGPLSPIHLNSSTIFLINKLHRYVWEFLNVIVYFSSLIIW